MDNLPYKTVSVGIWDDCYLESGPWFVQKKYNGHNCHFYKSRECRLAAFRRGRDLLALFPAIHGTAWFRRIEAVLPADSGIEVELFCDPETPGAVASALAKNPASIRVAIHSAHRLAGRDMGGFDCLRVYRKLTTLFGPQNNGIEIAPTRMLKAAETEKTLLAAAEQAGVEGYVLKRSNSEGWYKVKPVKDVDVIITGFIPGKGRNAGLVGSLRVSAFVAGVLREVARVSGFNDVIRQSLDESCVGKIIEVQYDSIGSRGRLVMPRFVRFRDDKPAEQCILAA